MTALAPPGVPPPGGQTEGGFVRRITRRLFVLMIAVLCLSSLSIAYVTLNEFNRLLRPELSRKAELIGQIAAGDVQRAIDYGVPFDQLVGADAYLDGLIADYEELAYAALVGPAGRIHNTGGEVDPQFARAIGSATPTELPDAIDHVFTIMAGDDLAGAVHIGVDRRFVQRQLDDIASDLIVILIVALLVTFEVMLVLVLFYVAGPIDRLNRLLNLQAAGDFSSRLITQARDPVGEAARYLSDGAARLHKRYRGLTERLVARLDEGGGGAADGPAIRLQQIGARFGLSGTGGPLPLSRATINDVRIPLFIFAFAEELQKSFLPLFVRNLYAPVPWLSEAVVISLPIAVYLAVMAIAAPFSGIWADRYGSRRIFLLGLAPAAAGYVGCALAQTSYELVLWRGTTALGYAMVTIACQAYVFGFDPTAARARSVSVFVGVIMSATMCGTAIGGILADRIGYRPVFLLAALLAAAAGFLAWRMLSPDVASPSAVAGTAVATTRLARWLVVLRNPRFALFLFCVAIPANVLAAAFLWYLVPLYLFRLGATPAEIARIMMLYYLIIVVAGPLASHLVDRFGRFTWLVVGLGSLLSGLGLAALYGWPSVWGIALAVGVMGVSHALTKAPQLALALEIWGDEIETVGRTLVLNFLRVLERAGMMLGLLLAAVLLDLYGYSISIGVTGMLVSGAAVPFLLVFALSGGRASASSPRGIP